MTLQTDTTRWSILRSDDYILCSQRWKSFIQSAKTRPGADCGSDHELFITKFRFKLNKVGKTTRPFRYDLNQIIYDYTVEVTNRFKGLHLIEYLKNYGQRGSWHCTGGGDQNHPQEEMQKRQNGRMRRTYKEKEKRREVKGKGERERYTHLNAV